MSAICLIILISTLSNQRSPHWFYFFANLWLYNSPNKRGTLRGLERFIEVYPINKIPWWLHLIPSEEAALRFYKAKQFSRRNRKNASERKKDSTNLKLYFEACICQNVVNFLRCGRVDRLESERANPTERPIRTTICLAPNYNNSVTLIVRSLRTSSAIKCLLRNECGKRKQNHASNESQSSITWQEYKIGSFLLIDFSYRESKNYRNNTDFTSARTYAPFRLTTLYSQSANRKNYRTKFGGSDL